MQLEAGAPASGRSGETLISFSDLFDARGTGDIAFSAAAGAMSGREIVIEGYLAHAHGPGAAVSLVDEPGACPDCSAVPVAVIALPDLRLVPREGEGTVCVAGRLEFGLRIVNGTASMLRIEQARIVEPAAVA